MRYITQEIVDNLPETFGIEIGVLYENSDSDFYYENITSDIVKDDGKLLKFANKWIAENINTDTDNSGKTLITIATMLGENDPDDRIILQGKFVISDNSASNLIIDKDTFY